MDGVLKGLHGWSPTHKPTKKRKMKMNSFAQKYPSFAALLLIISNVARDLVVPNETLLQKLENSVSLVPQVLAFVPQASALGAEVSALKSVPADIEAAAEALVVDLAFSSDKAKAIIAASFPLAEQIVALIPSAQAVIAAVKA